MCAHDHHLKKWKSYRAVAHLHVTYQVTLSVRVYYIRCSWDFFSKKHILQYHQHICTYIRTYNIYNMSRALIIMLCRWQQLTTCYESFAMRFAISTSMTHTGDLASFENTFVWPLYTYDVTIDIYNHPLNI